MFRFPKIPRKPLLAAALAAACLAAAACSDIQVREDEYADGTPKARSTFERKSDGALLRQGVQISWYPGGGKESMATYVNGYRQGYVFRWHPDGKLKSLEHFTDGMRDGQARFWDGAGNLVACFNEDAGDCRRAAAEERPSASEVASRP
jgi:hypothetical protein